MTLRKGGWQEKCASFSKRPCVSEDFIDTTNVFM
jgi:hypothetical protein